MALVHAHFFSNTLGMNVECEVILPEKMVKEGRRTNKIPVLWLLHGSGDDQTAWQRLTSIERYAKAYGIAVVMPDGRFSGYRNQQHGLRYFDYIADELPNVMHNFFGFSLEREDNYICGLSMGGNGALKMAMARPERYSAVGCLSAGFFDHMIPEDTMHLDPEKDVGAYIRYDRKVIDGSEEDMLNNARRIVSSGLPIPRVFHSIGERDHLLEIAHRTRDFFNSLEGNPFGYVYEEHPGTHRWEYWDEHIKQFLAFIAVK